MSGPRRVVVLADGDATGPRVRTTALRLAASGLDVTVVAADGSGPRRTSRLGPASVVRVPVHAVLSAAEPAAAPRLLGYRDARAETAARTWARLERERATAGGRRLRAGWWRGRELLVRARSAGQRRLDRDYGAVRQELPVTDWRRALPDVADVGLALVPEVRDLLPDGSGGVLHAVGVRTWPAALDVAAGRGDLAVVLDEGDGDAAPPAGRRRAAALRRLVAELGPRADAHLRSASHDPVGDLLDAYARLVPDVSLARDADVGTAVEAVEQTSAERRRAAGEVSLTIGTRNMAGQGWEWGQAVHRGYPAVRVEVVGTSSGVLTFPADELVDEQTWARDTAWQLRLLDHVVAGSTHVLVEAARAFFGLLHGRTFTEDARVLREAGLEVALVLHGSEIRDPRRHAAADDLSPFTDPDDDLTVRLVRAVGVLAPEVAAFDGPVFVSTPDLLEDVPRATWLPVVADPAVWRPAGPLPFAAGGHDVPLVVHTPSRAAIKGTGLLEPALHQLDAAGVIRYQRLDGVPPEAMRDVLADADVVVDQVAVGSYGVLACQAMALGRVVLGRVAPAVRDRVPDPVPVVDVRPQTVSDVLRGLAADPARAQQLADAGPPFVARWHDGRASAAALAPWLGLAAGPG